MSADLAALTSLEPTALTELQSCGDAAALRAWHTRYFGKQGEMLQALKAVGNVPPDQRKSYGQEANRIKEKLLTEYEKADAAQKDHDLERSLQTEKLDVTLPGRPQPRGRLHVANQTLRQIYAIFAEMGFQIYRSREVEDDLTNF